MHYCCACPSCVSTCVRHRDHDQETLRQVFEKRKALNVEAVRCMLPQVPSPLSTLSRLFVICLVVCVVCTFCFWLALLMLQSMLSHPAAAHFDYQRNVASAKRYTSAQYLASAACSLALGIDLMLHQLLSVLTPCQGVSIFDTLLV